MTDSKKKSHKNSKYCAIFTLTQLFSFLLFSNLALSESSQLKKTCSTHGGISCSNGMDADGSVICLDGFRDASARYRFYCSSAKLKIDSILPINKDKKIFKVLINNESQVKAKNVMVYILADNDTKTFRGPNEIEPNSLDEYLCDLSGTKLDSTEKIKEEIIIKCENCE